MDGISWLFWTSEEPVGKYVPYLLLTCLDIPFWCLLAKTPVSSLLGLPNLLKDDTFLTLTTKKSLPPLSTPWLASRLLSTYLISLLSLWDTILCVEWDTILCVGLAGVRLVGVFFVGLVLLGGQLSDDTFLMFSTDEGTLVDFSYGTAVDRLHQVDKLVLLPLVPFALFLFYHCILVFLEDIFLFDWLLCLKKAEWLLCLKKAEWLLCLKKVVWRCLDW